MSHPGPTTSLLAKLQPAPSAGRESVLQTTSLNDERSSYFCSVKLGETKIRVILYFPEGNPLGHVLLKRCHDADYECHLVHSEGQVIEQLEDTRLQAVVIVDACHKPSGSSAAAADETSTSGKRVVERSLNKLSSIIHSNGYYHRATLIGVIPDLSCDTKIQDLLALGVSHILTEEDCRTKRFELELKMVERTEAVNKERLLFSFALFEAVDQCNDAVQITSKDSTIIYVNRSFIDLSGYTRDEVIGKPAMDILKMVDSKTDNGPRSAVKKGHTFDGVCYGRRKSGSQVKQHLKLIPVKSTPEHVDHHVTIQRLLSSHGEHNLRSPSFASGGGDMLFPLRKHLHLHKMHPLEIPITKVVQLLIIARDNDSTPADVKEAVEKSIEILCSSELYAPVSSSGRPEDSRNYTGIVAGLLQPGSRWPVVDITTIARMSHPPHTHMTRNPPITPPPPDVQEALGDLSSWEFDIIKFEKLSQHQPLFFVGMKVFKEFEICDVLDIEETVLASWLKLMERHYHQQNSYHNSTHAADVLQATTYFVNVLQDLLVSQGEMLERIEIAALLISAVIHDLDHPARTNPHLCNTKHELALLYNDSAVLENHHIALSFKLTQQSKDVNIFQNLDLSVYRTLRSSIIDLVLATDMSKHFEHLTKFNVSSVDGESSSTTSLSAKESHEHRKVMKRILVKCADISNPCRPQKLCKEWAERIAEEYFAQTDDEKRMKLPVVFPDFDRHTCKLPVTQVKFIDFFISGLFEAWNNYCPIPVPMNFLKSNYTYWKSLTPDSPSNSASEEEIP